MPFKDHLLLELKGITSSIVICFIFKNKLVKKNY